MGLENIFLPIMSGNNKDNFLKLWGQSTLTRRMIDNFLFTL